MKKKRETSFDYVCRQLALECELKGEDKLAKEFRKAKHPQGLSKRAYGLYQKEMSLQEKDISGKYEDEVSVDDKICTLNEAANLPYEMEEETE